MHPGATEFCNGIDDNCNGLVDEDANGVDSDGDGVPNLCDNCPTVFNPTQDPLACFEQTVVDLTITSSSPIGKGSGTVTWTTSHEFDVKGYNVVVYDSQGNRVQQNAVLIPCEECITGTPRSYTFFVPKHKSGRSVFIEMLRSNGVIQTFGPAVRQ